MATPQRTEKIHRLVRQRQQGVVVLEDINDPHNAGAVFRTCDALGFHDIHIIFEQQTPRFDPHADVKASSTAVNRWLNFHVHHTTKDCLQALKANGYELIATILDDTSESLFEAELLTPKTALMMGNEHRGLSDTAIQMADRKLILPMAGMAQSMNLSVTTALFLFEISRQRHQAGIDAYRLSPSEQQALLDKYLDRESAEK
ncbi:MAG: RNA methyltransferase [Vampirovibrio sp.]|nr:RNA methyltransferase [Vampirovibrio sp.]